MKNNPNNNLPNIKGETTNQSLDTIDSPTDADNFDIIALVLLRAINQKSSSKNQKESA
jgi:hypothetical protein